MKPPRIYADTSVIGGCHDHEFRVPSVRLFDVFASGEATLVVSELTMLELMNAPSAVREVLDGVPEENREYLEFTHEAEALADLYVTEGVIGPGMRVDAQHIAIATVHRVDVLVSWNFKHIVNLTRIHGYNSVNLREGFPVLEIRTPEEVIRYER
jgi:hypothetical protein